MSESKVKELPKPEAPTISHDVAQAGIQFLNRVESKGVQEAQALIAVANALAQFLEKE